MTISNNTFYMENMMYVHVHLHAGHDSQSQDSYLHGCDTNQLSLSLTNTQL